MQDEGRGGVRRQEAEQGGADLEASEGMGGNLDGGGKSLPDKDPGFLGA